MATWAELEEAAPDLARFGLERLRQHGVGLGFLSTVRHHDGGPRVHPVCPILTDGRLYVSVATRPKTLDLRADPRYMLHAFPGREDAEFSIRGRAREVTDPDERERVIEAIDFAAYDPSHPIFELDIERADSTTWERWAQPDTRPIRRRWVAPAH